MAKITRSLKFQVSFEGVREKDFKGSKETLSYQLIAASGDLTAAHNRALTAAFLVRSGTLPSPTKTDKEGKEKPTNLQTLTYQAMNGTWQPFGKPMYEPKGRRLGSQPLLGAATLVYTRLQTDYKDVQRGEKSLPTFKSVPFAFSAQSVKFKGNGSFSVPLWEGTKGNRITLVPHRLDHGQREILNRIISGEYKLGEVKLLRHERKKRWMASLAWTGEVKEKEGDLIAGIDLGIVVTASMAYVDATGKTAWAQDTIRLPESTIRSWNRTQTERIRRLRFNRQEGERREGRGIQRKLRVVRVIDDKHARLVAEAIRQTASTIVKTAIKRGASSIILEDLSSITENKMAETESLQGKERASARRNFLRWNQGQLRQAIKSAGEREGLRVLEVNPSYTSKTCSGCQTIWKKPANGFGRISQSRFRCNCGQLRGKDKDEINADINAAINIARRGLEELKASKEPQEALASA